jgi:hypothetical protein
MSSFILHFSFLAPCYLHMGAIECSTTRFKEINAQIVIVVGVCNGLGPRTLTHSVDIDYRDIQT